MTPSQFIEQLVQLIASGRDREAIDFSARFWPVVAPVMTSAELMQVSDLMEGAETAVDVANIAGAQTGARDTQTT